LGKDINYFLIALHSIFSTKIGLRCIEIVTSGDGQGKP